MPWNGSGSVTVPRDFSAQQAAGAPNDVIEGSQIDEVTNDLADAIENTLARDGQNSMAANLNVGNYRLTNVATATAITDAPPLSQIVGGSYNWVGTFGGTATAWTATLTPAPTTLTAGFRVVGIVGTTSTGAVTLALNSIAAITVKRPNGNDLTAGAVVAGDVLELIYDGTDFVIQAIRPQQLPAGSLSSLSVSFESDTNTGFYLPAADTFALVAGGSNVFQVSADDITCTVSGAIRVPFGNTSERPASPGEAMFRYNTLRDTFEGFAVGGWVTMSASDPSGAFLLPFGSTAERPDPAEEGTIRYNTQSNRFEGFTASGWVNLS